VILKRWVQLPCIGSEREEVIHFIAARGIRNKTFCTFSEASCFHLKSRISPVIMSHVQNHVNRFRINPSNFETHTVSQISMRLRHIQVVT
jgi:hypothetical protein